MNTIAVEILRAWLEEQRLVTVLDIRLLPTPPHYERIVRLDEAGVLPERDLTTLEAGANRCAIA
jgi:hypothetical protein